MITPILGRPGIGAALTAAYGRVFRADEFSGYFPHGGVFDGTSRYYGGTTNLFQHPPGLMVGQVASTKKWKTTVIGTVQTAYTSGGTTLSLTAAQAVELARRVGSSGTFTLKGAATAAGTLTSDTVTFSAVNQTTGDVTITDIGANRIAGSIVVSTDGSGTPRSFIPDGFGIEVPPDSTDADFPRIPMMGTIDTAKILDYPTDTTLQQWIKDSMCANGRCLFIFSDEMAPLA